MPLTSQSLTGEDLSRYALVHRHHVGTTDQRRAAVQVLKGFTGRGSWDAADAIVEAWLAKAPAADVRTLAVLAALPDISSLQGEVERLRRALGVTQQALAEVSAAQQRGPAWYTRGEDGLREKVRTWVERGLKAADSALSQPNPEPSA